MTTTIGVCNGINGLLFGLTTYDIPVIVGLFDWFVMFKERCYIVKDRGYGFG